LAVRQQHSQTEPVETHWLPVQLEPAGQSVRLITHWRVPTSQAKPFWQVLQTNGFTGVPMVHQPLVSRKVGVTPVGQEAPLGLICQRAALPTVRQEAVNPGSTMVLVRSQLDPASTHLFMPLS
jgi:hypothetical protein